MQTDIIIIGAGVIGLSTAYHLARQNNKQRIVILEKEKFHGAGSTAQCTGGIRHQFTNQVNIQLTKISYPYFLRFAADMQYPIYFRQRGYLFVTARESRWQELQNMQEQLNRLDVPSQLLTPEEINTVYPFVLTGDLLGGSFCHLDAYADPYGVMEGYYRQCRKLGVQVLCNTEVTGINVQNNRVTGVLYHQANQPTGPSTEQNIINAPMVINAAGPHLHLLARMAGLELPASPYRRQVYVCAPMPAISASIPLIVDLDTGFYVHAEKNGILLLGGTDRDNAPGLEPLVDRSQLPDFIEAATGRVPALEDAQITRIYTGIRSLTPDGLGILGETEVSGFYCAGGFGGNGFMHAPAIGLITSCLVLGEQPPLDPTPLSPNRFNNAPVAEKALF
ncbi:NAD(P)/FAD-dependent oxidoreductase [Desulfoscipio gibsoniae]|uniref:Glycine/D-amino acid oxidase, deaminating n=1 Tax=Desulfoscipio gibsoniae DSM 7213 TaxID=767817 RepID=R4KGJ4_9FIRM|nr:FAD-dependent oxidoreductase [Desulfoscipio gibsoniae]AGL00782.1 glycine/D-amino acid oxidase, deaminating [Desulfoscipio gibsoniae DSM 7213]